MFHPLMTMFSEKTDIELKNAVAGLLSVSSDALDAFEKAYHMAILDCNECAKSEAVAMDNEGLPHELIRRIVDELLGQTAWISWDGSEIKNGRYGTPAGEPVTREEILALPQHSRPQLAGGLMQKDIDKPSYPHLLYLYKMYLETPDNDEKLNGKTTNRDIKLLAYHMFRQGLDILDLDHVLYSMLGMNRTSMGHWLGPIAEASHDQGFFLIPKTVVARVPMSILQMTRIEYSSLTPTTMKIVDTWARRVFRLSPDGDYLVVCGIFCKKKDHGIMGVSKNPQPQDGQPWSKASLSYPWQRSKHYCRKILIF